MNGRKTRIECPTPADLRWMRNQAVGTPGAAGCRVFGDHFYVTDEMKFLHLKMAAGAKEIGDEI